MSTTSPMGKGRHSQSHEHAVEFRHEDKPGWKLLCETELGKKRSTRDGDLESDQVSHKKKTPAAFSYLKRAPYVTHTQEAVEKATPPSPSAASPSGTRAECRRDLLPKFNGSTLDAENRQKEDAAKQDVTSDNKKPAIDVKPTLSPQSHTVEQDGTILDQFRGLVGGEELRHACGYCYAFGENLKHRITGCPRMWKRCYNCALRTCPKMTTKQQKDCVVKPRGEHGLYNGISKVIYNGICCSCYLPESYHPRNSKTHPGKVCSIQETQFPWFLALGLYRRFKDDRNGLLTLTLTGLLINQNVREVLSSNVTFAEWLLAPVVEGSNVNNLHYFVLEFESARAIPF